MVDRVKCFLEVYKAGIESFLSLLVVMYQAVHNEDGVCCSSSILPEAVLRVIQDSVNFNPPLYSLLLIIIENNFATTFKKDIPL